MRSRAKWRSCTAAASAACRSSRPTRSPSDTGVDTFAFTVNGIGSEGVATHLAERGVFASHGDFYASTIVEKLGLADAGLVRAGCAIYTTPDEIDRLLEGVASVSR